jgi:NAD(P)-dependent dehydrogenase (short-subunit alcohol dehydrogenase family)
MRAIVIGGSSGIGQAIALKCRVEGHEVLTMQRRGTVGAYAELDLRWSKENISEAMHDAVASFGGLDWLVISGGAAAYTRARAVEQTVEEMIRTNYLGPRWVFEAATKHLIRKDGRPSSRVLYVSSRITANPTKGLEDYAASKAAGETFFRHAGKRFGLWGIRTVCLSVGWVDTPMIKDIDAEILAKTMRFITIGRWIKASEVADVAYSVLSGPDAWTCDVVNLSGGI